MLSVDGFVFVELREQLFVVEWIGEEGEGGGGVNGLICGFTVGFATMKPQSKKIQVKEAFTLPAGDIKSEGRGGVKKGTGW